MSSLTKTIKNYLSLVTFSHTVFAMPFAFIGFSLAVTEGKNEFSFRLLLLIILCMIFARNAAMGFNRIADSQYDSLNPRTSNREIPAGKISIKSASVFVIINSVLFLTASGLINNLTLILSPAALLIILGYSLTKRITILCHFILGLGLSLAPIGAYISVTGTFKLLPVLYSLIVITWVSGFDIIYSLQDTEFDRKNKLRSIPSAKGNKKAKKISVVLHFISVILVAVAGFRGNSGIFYWAGAVIFTTMLIFQHNVVRGDDVSRINLSFGINNGITSIFFAFFVIIDLFLSR